jgi:hypothetical protein
MKTRKCSREERSDERKTTGTPEKKRKTSGENSNINSIESFRGRWKSVKSERKANEKRTKSTSAPLRRRQPRLTLQLAVEQKTSRRISSKHHRRAEKKERPTAAASAMKQGIAPRRCRLRRRTRSRKPALELALHTPVQYTALAFMQFAV